MRQFLMAVLLALVLGAFTSFAATTTPIENLSIGGGPADSNGGASIDYTGTGLWNGNQTLYDNKTFALGTDGDFKWKFNTSNSRLELNDAAGNTLGYWVDSGTAGNMVVSDGLYGQLLNLAHRTAPASPANGDVWTTTAGLYARINGVTVGPFISAAALGTMATQNANAVAITGGSIAGITDLAVADGGTGASDASTARTSLGLAIGTNVQAYSAHLAAIAALARTDGNIIVGDGSTWVAESGATARTSLGLGTASTPAFASLTLYGGAGNSLAVGSDNTGNTITNATTKNARIVLPHYTTAEEPVGIIRTLSSSSTNLIYFGGGVSEVNAATILAFYTAANNTTTAGTVRLTIDGAGLLRAYYNAQVDGNTQLGDSSADRFSVNTTPLTNKAAVIQGDLTLYKGSVPFDTALNQTDLGIYNPDDDSRLIMGQGSSDYAILSWDRNATPANAELRLEIPNGQAFRFLEGGNLVKAGTGNITWNNSTGNILGGALAANSVTDSQLSNVATAGTYNKITVSSAGRVTAGVEPQYGEIYISNGSLLQTSNASAGTYNTLDWADGANGLSNGVVPSYANDRVSSALTGAYRVTFHCSFSGTAGETFLFRGYDSTGGVAIPAAISEIKATGDVQHVTFSGFANLTSVSHVITQFACSSGSSKSITVKRAGLNIELL